MKENRIAKIKISGLKKEVTKTEDISIPVIENLSFEFELNNNSPYCILAPKGESGSLLIKMLSGVENITDGHIDFIADKKEGGLIKKVYIPKQASSFPWLNVKENIELALEQINFDPTGKAARVKQLISLCGLEGYDDHFPNNNSLGFRFRISLARALAVEPAIIFIDNSFEQMDFQTKTEMYNLLNELKSSTECFFVLATNNVSEAINISSELTLLGNKPLTFYENISVNGTLEEKQKSVINKILIHKLNDFCL